MAQIGGFAKGDSMAFSTIKQDSQGDGQVIFGGASSDAFDRGRVSEPVTLFDVHFGYDLQPLLMQNAVTGTGAVTKTSGVSSATLTTGGTASGAGVDFQSKQYCRYEPGKSQFISLTAQLVGYK
jgi:hypothetical protein